MRARLVLDSGALRRLASEFTHRTGRTTPPERLTPQERRRRYHPEARDAGELEEQEAGL